MSNTITQIIMNDFSLYSGLVMEVRSILAEFCNDGASFYIN